MSTQNNTQQTITTIVSAGPVEPIRNNQPIVSSLFIEIFHVFCFLIICYFIVGKDLMEKIKSNKKS